MEMIMILTACKSGLIMERRNAAKAEISEDISKAIKELRRVFGDASITSYLFRIIDLGLWLFPNEACVDVILGKFSPNPFSSVSHHLSRDCPAVDQGYADHIRAKVHGICLDCAHGRIHPVQPGCHNNELEA